MGAGELELATRGSTLALAQARLVQRALAAAAAMTCRIVTVTTRGDADRGGAADAAGGGGGGTAGGGAPLVDQARTAPGVFTDAVSAAVQRGTADAAVHSLKDLPLEQLAELTVAALLPRAAAHDVLLIDPRWFDPAAPLGLRAGAAVGTSSPRRAALLRHYAPAVRVVPLRGNVPTRVRACRDGSVAAVVLARAGLERLAQGDSEERAAAAPLAPPSPALAADAQQSCDLGAQVRIAAERPAAAAAATATGRAPPPVAGTALNHPLVHGLRWVTLPPEQWPPAPGQGAIAVQAATGGAAAELLATIDHAPTRTAVTLERTALQALGGGCGGAFGAYAYATGNADPRGDGEQSWRVYFGYAPAADADAEGGGAAATAGGSGAPNEQAAGVPQGSSGVPYVSCASGASGAPRDPRDPRSSGDQRSSGTGQATGAAGTGAAGTDVEHATGGWQAFRLQDSASGCRRALAAWAAGGAPPGERYTAEIDPAYWQGDGEARG